MCSAWICLQARTVGPGHDLHKGVPDRRPLPDRNVFP
jgi:hypothetical protein